MQAKLLALIIGISLLYSCQKEIEGSISTRQDGNPSNATGLMKRIYGESQPGTVGVDSFEYDSQRRLVKISSWIQDSTSIPARKISIETVVFFYNGVNDFPEKNISTYTDSFGTQVDTVLYFYDNQNRILKDEYTGNWYVNAGGKVLHEYTYGNNVICLKGYYQPDVTNNTRTLEFQDSLYYDGTNLTAWRSHTRQGDLVGANFTYDDKLNPFNALNITKYVGGGSSYGYGRDFLFNRTKNNIVSESSFTIYALPLTPEMGNYTYTYNYNTSLYPVKEMVINLTNPVYNGSVYYDYY